MRSWDLAVYAQEGCRVLGLGFWFGTLGFTGEYLEAMFRVRAVSFQEDSGCQEAVFNSKSRAGRCRPLALFGKRKEIPRCVNFWWHCGVIARMAGSSPISRTSP